MSREAALKAWQTRRRGGGGRSVGGGKVHKRMAPAVKAHYKRIVATRRRNESTSLDRMAPADRAGTMQHLFQRGFLARKHYSAYLRTSRGKSDRRALRSYRRSGG